MCNAPSLLKDDLLGFDLVDLNEDLVGGNSASSFAELTPQIPAKSVAAASVGPVPEVVCKVYAVHSTWRRARGCSLFRGGFTFVLRVCLQIYCPAVDGLAQASDYDVFEHLETLLSLSV